MMSRRHVELTERARRHLAARACRGVGPWRIETTIVKLWMLGSGSSGNAMLVECDGARLLDRLRLRNTHARGAAEHDRRRAGVDRRMPDHARARRSREGRRRRGQALGLGHVRDARHRARAGARRERPCTPFEPGMTLEFPRMTVATTSTPHDANQSVGFVVTSRIDRRARGSFYDIGHVTPRDRQGVRRRSTFSCSSRTTTTTCCAYGPYPPWLQARIAGRRGHLSNPDAARFARAMVTQRDEPSRARALERECNTPSVALDCMRGAIKGDEVPRHADRGETGRGRGSVHAWRKKSRATDAIQPVLTGCRVPGS